MERTKILIIGEKESFIIRVLLKKLEDARIEALFATQDVNNIEEQWTGISMVALYAEQSGEVSPEILRFLIDKLENDDKQVCLIGEPIDTDRLANQIPQELVSRVFPRPLDYDEFISFVNGYSQKAKTGELKKSILIVDDDPNYMSVVREWLKDTYKVSMATSGLRAIKWLVNNKVDLILLDYEMPVTDGPKVLEMLRADDETRKIPVIFLTGRDDKDSVMAVVSLKPEGYFLKTIGKDELMTKLKMFFLPKGD